MRGRRCHGTRGNAGEDRRQLSEEIQAYLRLPATEEKLKERGVIRIRSNPAEFRKLIVDDYELYKSAIKQAGIKAD